MSLDKYQMVSIYILKLENDKYYIGKTNDVNARLLEHLECDGSAWTKKYKPIRVLKVINNASHFDEDKYTKEYMSKYGIDNVRGGTYVKEKLDPVEIKTLQKEIWASTNCCTRCGRKSHFIAECNAKTDINNVIIDDPKQKNNKWSSDESSESSSEESNKNRKYYHKKFVNNQKKQTKCYRCKRPGHFADNCYATTDAYGKKIYD